MAKEWKREASVKAAIKKLGLNLMNYRTTTTMTGYSALFYVHDEDDKAEVESRGFNAIINPSKAAG